MNCLSIVSIISVAFFAASGHASEENTDYLAAYAGYFDITNDEDAAQFGLEYRYQDIFHGLRPTAGFNVTTDESTYAYAGFYWDIPLSERWILSPNIVAGAYSQGDGKDLGNGIEFRHGLEASYQFDNQSRLGIAFNHISNGSLGDNNPGAETLLISYQHPLNWLN